MSDGVIDELEMRWKTGHPDRGRVWILAHDGTDDPGEDRYMALVEDPEVAEHIVALHNASLDGAG